MCIICTVGVRKVIVILWIYVDLFIGADGNVHFISVLLCMYFCVSMYY